MLETLIHPKTLGAKLHTFIDAICHNPRLMQIGLENSLCSSFGVTDIVAVHDAFATVLAFLSHR